MSKPENNKKNKGMMRKFYKLNHTAVTTLDGLNNFSDNNEIRKVIKPFMVESINSLKELLIKYGMGTSLINESGWITSSTYLNCYLE